ncbi:MAG: DUF2088 domain-containing protein [Caldilineales bacterium]|nr:DUF2088 domain-containing protein [Caldilineales bacterium]
MLTSHAHPTQTLTEPDVRGLLQRGLGQIDVSGKRLLVLIPDGTRSGPIPLFFRLIHEILGGEVAALDYLIALGTHQPMPSAAIARLTGASAADMAGRYRNVRVLNHAWQHPDTFVTLGVIPAAEIEGLSNGLFAMPVPVALNRLVLDYDHILICGPVFPHEVAGFSGGNKYFFPGIAGQEIIDFTHWLGALITNYEIIGVKHTPVRAVIERAAAMIPTPTSAICFVVTENDLHGVFTGPVVEAWAAAADLAAQTHILWVDRAYDQVLSVMPRLYDDIWTAAKGMYKLEPVIADGGRVTIYAPHIDEISYTHGRILDEIGYHVRDYFVKQWDRFKHYPWGVLAHSTHLRGMGAYENGVETPRVDVSLATAIPPERVRRVNLDYTNPAAIRPEAWAGQEDAGILLVPHAGEMLYRLKPEAAR